MISMVWIWTGAIVLFAILEAATTALVSVWFVVGAAAALLSILFGFAAELQFAVFVLVSAAFLLLLRPFIRRITKKKPEATNADRVIGQFAQVTECIDNDNKTGTVYVCGKTWTARSMDGQKIEFGKTVKIASISGVTLYVVPVTSAK